ncbi:MAG: hypothetical protein AAF583_17595 [Pseudomonadota bacterium]
MLGIADRVRSTEEVGFRHKAADRRSRDLCHLHAVERHAHGVVPLTAKLDANDDFDDQPDIAHSKLFCKPAQRAVRPADPVPRLKLSY